MPDFAATALPLRPAHQPSSSSRVPQPTRYYPTKKTPQWMMHPRPLTVQLSSLRERSNESSSSTESDDHERIDACEWTGSGPEYLEFLGRCKPTIRPVASEAGAHEEYKYTGHCRSPGNGDLTIDMIPSPEKSTHEHTRQVSGSSSNYSNTPSLGDGDTLVVPAEPPASPPHTNTLNLRDLEKYSIANDHLSNLGSGSESAGGESVHGAAEDADVATQGWQSVVTRSKGRLDDGTAQPQEVAQNDGPSGDSNERDQETNPLQDPPRNLVANRGLMPRESLTLGRQLLSSFTQYDGIYEFIQQNRPGMANTTREQATTSTEAAQHTTVHGSTKRKPSHFSLRSLSNATKRPRRTLRKFAATVHRGFSKARWKLRQRTAADRRSFEAWRANRRRERPGDAIKGKHEGGYGTFNMERSRHKVEDWWQEGVCKYEAPRWMVFRSGFDREGVSSKVTSARNF